ncbi:hypothetical protein ACIGG9_24875 [Pseudonocardia alni]
MIFDAGVGYSIACECCGYLEPWGDEITKLVNVAIHEWEVHGYMHQ